MSTTDRRKTLFLLNGTRKDPEELVQPLEAYMPGSKVIVTTGPTSAGLIIREYSDYDIFVAGGGDGTLNSVVNGILNNDLKDKIVGVLPLGTGNDFASLMGYDPKQFCSLTGRSRKKNCVQEIRNAQIPLIETQEGSDEYITSVDVGQFQVDDIEPTYFISNVGVGFFGEVVKKLNGAETSAKRYVLRAIKSYATQKKLLKEMNIKFMEGRPGDYLDGKLDGEFFSVEIMNSPLFGRGLRYSPLSSVKDGKLEMVILKNVKPRDVIPMIMQVKAGRGQHLNRKDNIIYKDDITNLWIKSKEEFYIHYDGETYREPTTNLEVMVHPQKLKFIKDVANIYKR